MPLTLEQRFSLSDHYLKAYSSQKAVLNVVQSISPHGYQTPFMTISYSMCGTTHLFTPSPYNVSLCSYSMN